MRVHDVPLEADPEHLRAVINHDGARVIDGDVFAITLGVDDLAHQSLRGA